MQATLTEVISEGTEPSATPVEQGFESSPELWQLPELGTNQGIFDRTFVWTDVSIGQIHESAGRVGYRRESPA